MKAAPVYHNEKVVGQRIFCPGCQCYHMFTTDPTSPVHWVFNGDPQKPTFTPSLMCNRDYPESRCHSVITDGKIQFFSECYHSLKGQTVELPDVEPW